MSSFVREHTRYPVELAVRMNCGSWGDYLELYTSNLSRGGLFVPSRISAPIGTEVGVELTLPDGKALSMRAEVVHVNEEDAPGRSAGMGLMFIDLDHQTREAIESMVRLARAQKLSAKTPPIADPMRSTSTTATKPSAPATTKAVAIGAIKPVTVAASRTAATASKPAAVPPTTASKPITPPASASKPAAAPPATASKPITPPASASKPVTPTKPPPPPPAMKPPSPPVAASKPAEPKPLPLPPPPSASGWDVPDEEIAVPVAVEEEREIPLAIGEPEIADEVEEPEVPVVIEEDEAPVAAAAPQARAPQFADVVEQALLDELGRRMDLSPHAQLGIAVDASDEELAEAYERLRDRYAPAIFTRYGESTALVVKSINDAINAAHERLRDPSQRQALLVEAHTTKTPDESPEVVEQKRRGEEARTALRAGIERRVEEACAHRDMGRLDDAIRGFEAVLALDRKHEYAREELKKLREKREAATHKPSGGLFDRLRKR